MVKNPQPVKPRYFANTSSCSTTTTRWERPRKPRRDKASSPKSRATSPINQLNWDAQNFLQRLGSLCERVSTEKPDGNEGNPVCLISGGEFACPVKGDGMGGRNLETALRLAIEYHAQHVNKEQPEKESHFVALCAGTDGIDGNSPVAGAIVDDTTIERANAIGLDARRLPRSQRCLFVLRRAGRRDCHRPNGNQRPRPSHSAHAARRRLDVTF